jgi:hypothetical protein
MRLLVFHTTLGPQKVAENRHDKWQRINLVPLSPFPLRQPFYRCIKLRLLCLIIHNTKRGVYLY